MHKCLYAFTDTIHAKFVKLENNCVDFLDILVKGSRWTKYI